MKKPWDNWTIRVTPAVIGTQLALMLSLFLCMSHNDRLATQMLIMQRQIENLRNQSGVHYFQIKELQQSRLAPVKAAPLKFEELCFGVEL